MKKQLVIFSITCWVFSPTVLVAEVVEKQASQNPFPSGSLFQALITFIFVIAMIFVVAYLFRRFSFGRYVQSEKIKTLASVSIGPKERLVLVQAGDVQILLGVTSSQVNTIHVFEDPLVVATEASRKIHPFMEKMQEALKRRAS